MERKDWYGVCFVSYYTLLAILDTGTSFARCPFDWKIPYWRTAAHHSLLEFYGKERLVRINDRSPWKVHEGKKRGFTNLPFWICKLETLMLMWKLLLWLFQCCCIAELHNPEQNSNKLHDCWGESCHTIICVITRSVFQPVVWAV